MANNTIQKKDVTKTFCFDKFSFDKLTRWANERSISRSAALRVLINEHCKGEIA